MFPNSVPKDFVIFSAKTLLFVQEKIFGFTFWGISNIIFTLWGISSIIFTFWGI